MRGKRASEIPPELFLGEVDFPPAPPETNGPVPTEVSDLERALQVRVANIKARLNGLQGKNDPGACRP